MGERMNKKSVIAGPISDPRPMLVPAVAAVAITTTLMLVLMTMFGATPASAQTDTATITVNKFILGPDDGSQFEFQVRNGDVSTIQSASIGGGESHTFTVPAAPSTTRVAELVPPGWDLEFVDCETYDANGDFVDAGQQNAAPFFISPAAGYEVECTFSNRLLDPVTITLAKEVVGDPAPAGATFDISTPQGLQTIAVGDPFVMTVAAGSLVYVIEEPTQANTTVAPVPSTPDAIYSCPTGFIASGSGPALTCSRTVVANTTTAPVATVPSPIYSCPLGFTGSGSGPGLTCSRTVQANTTVPANVNQGPTTYSCPAGFIASGSGASTTCSRTSAPNQVCPAGTTETSTGVCKVDGAPGRSVASSADCSAAEGFAVVLGASRCFPVEPKELVCSVGTLSGATCVETTANVPETPAPTYSCPAGSTATSGSGANTVCTVPGTATESAPSNVTQGATTYSCPAGSTDTGGSGPGLICTVFGTAEQTAAANVTQPATTYSCPAGSSATSGSGPGLVCTVSSLGRWTAETVQCDSNVIFEPGFTGANGEAEFTVRDGVSAATCTFVNRFDAAAYASTAVISTSCGLSGCPDVTELSLASFGDTGTEAEGSGTGTQFRALALLGALGAVATEIARRRVTA